MWFRRFLFLCFVSVVFFANAQNGKRFAEQIDENTNSQISSSFRFIKIHETLKMDSGSNKATAILQLLERRNIYSPKESIALNLTHQIKSLVGEHFTFVQELNNIPIYGAGIKVNIDKNNIVRTILSNLRIDFNIDDVELPYDIDIKAITDNYIESNSQNMNTRNSEWNYYINEDKEVQLVVKTNVYIPNATYNKEVIISLSGQVIEERDLNVYYKPPFLDSLVNVMVFNPDPLTTAGVTYGVPYVDSSDKNTFVLKAQRQLQNIRVEFLSDTFFLKDSIIVIKDIFPPSKPIIYSLSPSFDFTRDTSAFEDVNAYYHIKTFNNYIKSIGCVTIAKTFVSVDPHGDFADQSYFSATPPRLIFGDGGVDDAEDADVIIHEYGHALSNTASPGTNNGVSVNGFKERQSLDEGLGDYVATSYSRSINAFNWQNVFNWDGHNEFWPGRDANTSNHYPENLGGSIHENGQMWASALMQVWGDIGQTTTDKLVLQSLFSWYSGMSMVDAADIMIITDSILNAGVNKNVLVNRFIERGFYIDSSGTPPDPPVDTPITELLITNTQGFLQGIGDLQITFPDSMIFKNIRIDIYDITGRLVISIPQQLIQNDYAIATNLALARGIYFIRIFDETGRVLKVEKIVK